LRFIAGGAALALASRGEAAWKLVTLDGQEYVTVKGIKEFYKFTAVERSGATVALRSARLVLRLRSGSQEMYVNGVKFMLSLPVASQGNDVLVSRIDLSKLIDPVLRPSHIAKGPPFTTVVVDPGHGGHDSGARGVFGNEETYTLDTSLRLARLLQARGLKVLMTRTRDSYPSLPQRVAAANAAPSSIFVSVHFNSGGSHAQGVETYALAPQGTNRSRKEDNENDAVRFRGNSRDSENIALATAVHASMLYQLKAVDRGVLRDRWFLLKGIQTPGILVEGGFITSPAECAKIHTPQYRERLAGSIAAGIMNYRNALRRS
jgi:N-acetylmuramoyl-L-alanine amidase